MLRFVRYVLLFLGGFHSASAHEAFESWTMARLSEEGLRIQTTLSVANVPILIDKSAQIDLERFDSYQSYLIDYAPNLFDVSIDGGRPIHPIAVKVEYIEEDYDIQIQLDFEGLKGNEAKFEARYLELLEDHTGKIFLQDEVGVELGWSDLTSEHSFIGVVLPSTNTDESFVPAAPPPAGPRFRKFVLLGLEHILEGYDHLLFLAGLLVVVRRFANMATIITCFTLAHSITLGLSALQYVSIPGKIVEPLIAASIVYVGIDNLLRRGEPTLRWTIAFAFGLIHGFGFAGALRQTGLGSSGSGLLLPLFSFNLGVELGQIAMAAIFVPLLWKLNKGQAFKRYGSRSISLVVALVGSYWLLQRTLLN